MAIPEDERVVGSGGPDSFLTEAELVSVTEEALSHIAPGSRVLAIIPDKTRDDNTHVLLPAAAKALASNGVTRFDALVAQGTHPPMTFEEKLAKVGGADGRLPEGLGEIFDHRWDDPSKLASIGRLESDEVRELTGGLLSESIELSINKLLSAGNYDHVLIFGATVPHEVVGFAGGAKYFFPGVAGPELTHATHWLGALVTIEETIGRIETPTRRMIEAAADRVPARITCFTSVSTRGEDDRLRTHALFAGDFREAFRRAAEVSREVHIKFVPRTYKRVVALLDEHYEDLWVGGKASYKLGGIIEEGGELIIYAPHLHSVSEIHGRLIEKFGYAPLESVKEAMASSAELRGNRCVAAHLTHVAYAGRRDAEGLVTPKYRITLATGLDRETCERIRLHYLDHSAFQLSDYRDGDTLIVEKAGRDLYLLEP